MNTLRVPRLAPSGAYKQSLDDRDLAQGIVDAVRGGQSFEDAAAAAGVATPNDVGLRPISYGREAINAAFTAATEVGMLDVVEDGGRFSLIEVYDIQAPEIQSFEDYRPTAQLAVAGPQASTILGARFDELDGLVGTMSLEDAAAQVDLPVISGEMAQSGLMPGSRACPSTPRSSARCSLGARWPDRFPQLLRRRRPVHPPRGRG